MRIYWKDISPNEIHGTLEGRNEPIFILTRENKYPFFWNITGPYDDRDQYGEGEPDQS